MNKILSFGRIWAVAFVCATVTSFISPAWSDKGADSIPDAKAIGRQLENIEKQLADLESRQEQLLKDLESLKVVARRH
ncbi:MAG: hypothetical protein HY587_07945 [Candidatus Omnitrophica bacterium]|nr:hypothetical protein [Candidatus Omnitrophota bacterium]